MRFIDGKNVRPPKAKKCVAILFFGEVHVEEDVTHVGGKIANSNIRTFANNN